MMEVSCLIVTICRIYSNTVTGELHWLDGMVDGGYSDIPSYRVHGTSDTVCSVRTHVLFFGVDV